MPQNVAARLQNPPADALSRLSHAARAALDARPEAIVHRWLAALSPTARRAYRLALQRFAGWALAEPTAPPEQALRLLVEVGCGPAHELVTRWRDELLATGLATTSVAVMTTSISSLLKVCRRLGMIHWRLESVAPRQEHRTDRRGPARAEVESMLATVDSAAATGDRRAVRDALTLRLLFGAALRRSEVCNLRYPEDVDLERTSPAVCPKRKARKERQWMSIAPRTASALRAWLAVRGVEPGPLVHRVNHGTKEPGHLSGETVRRVVAEWATRAGVKTKVRPHGLRHAAATLVAREGSLDELMSVGGWQSFAAARRYLDSREEQRERALRRIDS